jgi:hypothetical protein
MNQIMGVFVLFPSVNAERLHKFLYKCGYIQSDFRNNPSKLSGQDSFDFFFFSEKCRPEENECVIHMRPQFGSGTFSGFKFSD